MVGRRHARDFGGGARRSSLLGASGAPAYNRPWHPVLVTIPIGAWVCSMAFDIGSHVAGYGDAFARSSRWLIAIGVVMALLAAVVGTLDLFSTVTRRTPAFRTGLLHLVTSVVVVGVFAIDFLWRWLDRDPGAVGLGQIVLSAVALVGLVLAGYLGGKIAHRFAVGHHQLIETYREYQEG